MRYFEKNGEIFAFNDDQLHLVTNEMVEINIDELTIRLTPSKAELQAQMWERIKQKRHDNARGGVYIKSIGKWFHNDDPTRTQYLALQLLPQLPENLIWKTMDNEFVPMTKALLTEIAMTMLTEEQNDFANAERHRLSMLQAENPLEYDYSTGWSNTYNNQGD